MTGFFYFIKFSIESAILSQINVYSNYFNQSFVQAQEALDADDAQMNV